MQKRCIPEVEHIFKTKPTSEELLHKIVKEMASGGESSPSPGSDKGSVEMEEAFMEESSSSPDRDRRGRGRGRGRRGVRGRGSRSRSGSRGTRVRGSGSRGRGRGRGGLGVQREVDVLEVVQQRQASMREELSTMTRDEMLVILQQAVTNYPGLMFDIMRPAQQQPGGYHPGPGDNVPDWCVCGHCRQMPTEEEKICCEKENCISLIPDFQVLVLDEGVLAIARMYRRDILVYDDEPDQRKANRHQAYRQYILWTFGRLGVGDRRVIPSCCVWKIRDKYPDPFGQYTGFIPVRI